jgi:ligand-binding sensor domain-containing protein
MMKRNFCLAFFSIVTIIWSVTVKGESDDDLWQSYFSYSNCFDVEETDTQWIGAASVGLVCVDKTDFSISTFTTTDGLSDFEISSILGDDDRLFIGYTDGNIDILQDGSVTNINDLELESMSGSKQINHFLKIDDLLYCATDFGILVLNLDELEVASTYYIGDNASDLEVYQLATDGTYLYAATAEGVLRASLSASDIHVYTAWDLYSPDITTYSSVVVFDEKVMAVEGEVGSAATISQLTEAGATTLTSVTTFESLECDSEHLWIVGKSAVLKYDEDLSKILTINNPTVNEVSLTANFSALVADDSNVWLSDRTNGILYWSDGAWQQFLPDGPVNNYANYIAFYDGNLWVTPGGMNSAWGNLYRWAAVSVLTSGGWQQITRTNTPELYGTFDMLTVASSDSYPSKIYANSWGSGVFEIEMTDDSATLINHFFTPENGLVNIYGGSSNYVRVATSVVDDNNVVWMTNSEVENSIVAYFPETDEWQRYSYGAISNNAGLTPLINTSWGDKWLSIRKGSYTGLFVWNDNDTPEDQTDDYYKSAVPTSVDDDSRNLGQFLLLDGDGEEVTDNVYAIAEDLDGEIWLGTDEGILVNYQPSSLLTDDSTPTFSHITVARDDGSGLADYLLGEETVTCIAVDPGNRKWLGTSGSGVYLVSEDGTEEINAFSTSNSSLPSDYINAIAIDENTGEVFFATSEGIVSYQGDATEGEDSFSEMYVYPNPVRPDFEGNITITGLMTDSNVKITDTAGRLVYETTSVGGQAFWDGYNFWGKKVKTGIYLIFVASSDGSYADVTKVAVVR